MIRKESFKNPDRRYAIYPLHETGFCERAEKIEELLACGYGGVAGCVRYSAEFPHNEKDWEDAKDAFHKLIDAGMYAWIYDEYGYPSGTAGGAVFEHHPEFIAEGLYCFEDWRIISGPGYCRADLPGDKIFKVLLLPTDGTEPIDVTDSVDENGTLRLQVPNGTFHVFSMSSRRLFDGTHAAESYSEPRNYVCLCDQDATKEFLRVTHENYEKRLKDEFGKHILAFFTDEPSLIAWYIRQGIYPVLPWHRSFPEKFQERFGYPIELAVVAVIKKYGTNVIKRRCDFWDFIADGVAEGYFGTIQDWCREHGIKSSGHLIDEEHLSTHVITYGSMYRSMKRMDWPGIDQLQAEPYVLMNRDSLPIARLAASVADVHGEGESFTEFSDYFASHGGHHQIGMPWIKASINWHIAMGINNFVCMYEFNNFSTEELFQLNQYTARLGYLLREGKRDSKVALLYPEATVWAAYTPTTAERGKDEGEDTKKVEDVFCQVSWELLERQIDFDYVDEQLIQDGAIKGQYLCYRNSEYQTIVFPAAKVLSRKTMDKIEEMLEAGVNVVFVGGMPVVERERGENEDFALRMSKYCEKSNFYASEVRSLPGVMKCPALAKTWKLTQDNPCLGEKVVDGERISSSILSHMRVAGDKRILFLANMEGREYIGKVIISGSYSVQVANPENGVIEECEVEYMEGQTIFAVDLKAYKGLGYILNEK